ncbi:MAG: alpha-ketoglutarate-dependent dioxygenase AlkB [Pseudomonadota bacterium]|nr:alpha-ketoglutarate-dependent dioxygenase AlkB [Pseudomonadota bacterium]
MSIVQALQTSEPFLALPDSLLAGPGLDDQPPLLWFPRFLPAVAADRLLAVLREQVAWEQRSANFGGRRVAVPRLIAWYGEHPYRYAGFTHAAAALPVFLAELLPALQALLSARLGAPVAFDSVLLNRYRDGRDSMSFHSDNEVQLGPEPVIASLSLGASRTLQFRAIGRQRRLAGTLTHGSLLVMHGRSQSDWQHAVPKEACEGERINLTFRRTGPLRPGPPRRASG